jgi:antitoxin MazE
MTDPIDDMKRTLSRIDDRLADSERHLRQAVLTPNKTHSGLTLTLPWPIVNALHLGEGINVDLEISDGRIIVTPQAKTEYSLDELLAGVTEDNCHDEVSWGPALEGETW